MTPARSAVAVDAEGTLAVGTANRCTVRHTHDATRATTPGTVVDALQGPHESHRIGLFLSLSKPKAADAPRVQSVETLFPQLVIL